MNHPTSPTPLTDRLYEYVLSVGVREPDLLRRLREETAKRPEGGMQIAAEQGPFLALLVRLLGAKACLEVGTFTGYSALWVASALPADGRVLCCEISDEYAAIARRYWAESEHGSKIALRMGPALETLDALLADGRAGTFDYAFIDADKVNYDGYYERALKLVRVGGVIAIDNTLWDGRVAEPNENDPDTAAIRALNAKLFTDERVMLSFLPFADGLSLLLRQA